jgi:hypothetical protein
VLRLPLCACVHLRGACLPACLPACAKTYHTCWMRESLLCQMDHMLHDVAGGRAQVGEVGARMRTQSLSDARRLGQAKTTQARACQVKEWPVRPP